MHPPSVAVWPANVESAAREVDALPFRGSGWTSTYPGHAEVYTHAHGLDEKAPNPGKYGVDFMVSSKAQGDRIADYLWSNRKRLGIRYVIWWGRIISETGAHPGTWLRYFNADNPNPSKSHHNHPHASFYADAGPYTPPSSTPSAPSGTVPAATTGKAPLMAEASPIQTYFREDQPLNPGDNVVWLGPKDAAGDYPLSVLKAASDGVDLTATLEVQRDGVRTDTPEVQWRTVAYQKGKPTTTVTDEISVRGDQVRFAGSFNTKPAAGKSNRLRLVVIVPEGVTGLVLHRGKITGWAL